MSLATSPRPTASFGSLLREWRRRRRISQLDLALEAEVSSRHLSFMETGRSQPSREMVLRLAEPLGLPLRDCNALLLAAGYAPAFPERGLDEPAMAPAREMLERLLKAHHPWPAIAVDRHWTLVAGNAAVSPLLDGCADRLLAPPVNVLRLSLDPGGLAPRIVNLPAWRDHILSRLRRQIVQTADPVLEGLLRELAAYPVPEGRRGPWPPEEAADIAIPFQLLAGDTVLSFLSTTMVFGTPRDVTLAELAIEIFLPADAATAAALAARD